MAANRPLIVSDLLCYAFNKISRVANKPLKSTLIDFYSVEDIANAKEILYVEMDKIFVDKWSKPARRRKDSVNRSTTEIDDILNMLTTADENKMLD